MRENRGGRPPLKTYLWWVGVLLPCAGLATAGGIRLSAAVGMASAADSPGPGELIQNGSFEAGPAGWQMFGGTARLVADAHDGAAALRVEGRSRPNDGLRQDLAAALSRGQRGAGYVVRFWMKLDQPASVRAILRLSDGAGSRLEILAERVVRATGEWVKVDGSRPISWQGALTDAQLTFEVAEVPERVFPAFTLDGVSIAPDGDGDHLSDAEERAAGTDPAAADTDGDGMPDGWEIKHALNPKTPDDQADADRDGFTNAQEYWAATNPRSAASLPGRPADEKASAATRAVLRYLALLPSQKNRRVVVGQHVTNTDPEYESEVVRLQRETGRWPALLCLQYDGQSQEQPLQVEAVNRCALEWWRSGGLVLIKFAVFNPWPGSSLNHSAPMGANDPVDIPGLLDPARSRTPEAAEANRKAHDTYFRWLEQVAAGLAELQRQGVVVLWRPCSEMNGGWFWWGRRPRAEYIALWRHMFSYLTETKGLHNLIWVYESDSSTHTLLASDYYYPGDDVVDVMGHNFYNDTWELPFDAEGVYRQYPKVYAFPQAGSTNTTADGSWDNLTFTDAIRKRFPRCSFFAAWNSFTGRPKPGARVIPLPGGRARVVRSIVDNRHASELMHDPWIVTREDLPFDGFLNAR